jgi:hypothetical protein
MWLYNKLPLDTDMIPDNSVGFIYKIIHIPTGKFYIGKKSLIFKRNVRLGKKELQTIQADRKQNKVRGRLPVKKSVIKDSDWETYYSSNAWIKEHVKSGNSSEFERSIIQFCTSTKSLSYWETYWLFKYEVLTSDMALNDNILGKFYRKDTL